MHRTVFPTAFTLGLAVILPLGACEIFAPDGDAPVAPGEPITELPRGLTVAERQTIASSNAFGFELLREVATRDARPNILLSPLSASMSLGMTLNGADGVTFDAMSETLGFAGMTQRAINQSYADLIELLTTLDPAVTFEIANSVWARNDVPFRQAFLDAVAAAFRARIESRDFRDPRTVDAINDWVAESTTGLIDRIVEELDPNLVMLLINAIYFEGSWTTRFDAADTRRADFHRADESVVRVDMLQLTNVDVASAGGDGYSAVELPYGGEAFSMIVVLPWEDARAFVSTLDAERWAAIVDGLRPRSLDQLSLPKFTIAYDAYLNDPLVDMGMENAFLPGADFTRMSPIGDQLCIAFVRQKTYLEVDERGTRAAAVTATGVGAVSFNGFIVDRPFIVAIRDRLSGTVLFAGLIGDPTYQDPGAEGYTNRCG